jgi:hypothetical protein
MEDRKGRIVLGVWEVWIAAMLMLRKKMGRARARDGELVSADGGKEEVKDEMGLSWVWVDSVGISDQIIPIFEMGMRIAITTRTKIRKGFPQVGKISIWISWTLLRLLPLMMKINDEDDECLTKASRDDDDFDENLGDTDDRDADVEGKEYEEPQEPLYPGLYTELYTHLNQKEWQRWSRMKIR